MRLPAARICQWLGSWARDCLFWDQAATVTHWQTGIHTSVKLSCQLSVLWRGKSDLHRIHSSVSTWSFCIHHNCAEALKFPYPSQSFVGMKVSSTSDIFEKGSLTVVQVKASANPRELLNLEKSDTSGLCCSQCPKWHISSPDHSNFQIRLSRLAT